MSVHEQTMDPAADLQGPPHVHHMDSTTAYNAAKLGMWLFLATEILLFGGLFAAFALYHWQYFEEFHRASAHLQKFWGSTNTVILLFSSYTAALAVSAAQRGDNKRVRFLLSITLICGLVFLGIKGIEYHHKYVDGLFPGTTDEHGIKFASPEFAKEYKSFFGLYFCMTGLHALHVIFGMTMIFVWPFRLARKNRFSARYYTPVEVGALYWHLVDLIWIYLFPLLYLVG